MKKYQIIYADPPWNFGNRMYSSNHLDHHREITRAYPVLNTKDICNLPVRDITDNDCVCFMWVADAFIPDAMEVMKAWGFKYKTVAFTWVKINKDNSIYMGMGRHTRANAEICLLGIRGKGLPRQDAGIYNTQLHVRGKHSEKPPAFRRDIEKLYGNVTRIELFARQKVDSWDCWGNEVESDMKL